MWTKIAIFGLVTTSITGLNQAYAYGATAIAMDMQNIVYRFTHPSLSQAFHSVLNYCATSSGQRCLVIGTSAYSGYGAVAQSATRYGTAMGYATQKEANRVALNGCASQLPVGETCVITLEFFDGN